MVLVFGIVGFMVAFGPLGVQAGTVTDAANTDGSPQGNKVTGVKVEAVPNTPNTVAKWTIQFMNGDIMNHEHVDANDNGMIDAGEDRPPRWSKHQPIEQHP